MSRTIDRRLAKIEALNLNVTTELRVHRADDPAALFPVVIPYQEPAEIELEWPERGELLTESEDDTP